MIKQTRNQEFFRSGEVFWNNGNKHFISNKRKKGPAGRSFGNSFVDTLKIEF